MGKVWQYTACDAACSYAVARLSTEFSAEAAAQFFRQVVAYYARAGWPVQRVLSDQGNEYRGAFDQACRELRVRHTRTKPRTRGPMGSSSGCGAPSSASCGGWSSRGASSLAWSRCRRCSITTCTSTTGAGRIWATGSKAAHRPSYFSMPEGSVKV